MWITDINLQMPFQDFERQFQDCIDNWSYTMNYTIKTPSTRMGKHLYKITVDNNNGSSIDVVALKDDISPDTISFKPLKLSNLNESFYSYSIQEEDIIGTEKDPTMLLCSALKCLCVDNNGTFAYIDSNNVSCIVKDGNIKRKVYVGLVDDNGDVYSTVKAESISYDSDNAQFHVKTPIQEWLREHDDVANAIQTLPIDEKMNYIGKYLIQARVNDEIDTSEFADIFCQAGLFGFSDPSVMKIYKLFM